MSGRKERTKGGRVRGIEPDNTRMHMQVKFTHIHTQTHKCTRARERRHNWHAQEEESACKKEGTEQKEGERYCITHKAHICTLAWAYMV